MRSATIVPALILLTGCAASGTVGESDTAPPSPGSGSVSSAPSSSGASATSPSSAPASAQPSAPAAASLPPGFTMVSGNLAQPGYSGFGSVASNGAVVAASTFTMRPSDSTPATTESDIGLVFSTDGGLTWTRGGDIALPDSQHIGGLMITDDGIVMVGSTSRKQGKQYVDDALIVAAPAPDYVPQVVQTPKAFAGDSDLVAVFKDGTDWVIIGATARPEKGNSAYTDSIPTVWRSADQGTTWTKTVVPVKGSTDNPLASFAIAPDGSWNLFGESYPVNNGPQQFNASWLRSTDKGASFELMYPNVFRAAFDQGVSDAAFSPSGAVAMYGWDEVNESGDEISVAWSAPSGAPLTTLGDPTIPVQGGTPPGQFVGGVMWQDEDLIMWGRAGDTYPMPEVQFWALDGAEFVPTTTLPGNGQLIGVQHILDTGDTLLAFGTTGPDKDQRNLAVWAGSLTASE